MTLLIICILVITIYILKRIFKIDIITEDTKKRYNKGNKLVIETRLYYRLFNLIPFLYFRRILDLCNHKEMFTIRIFYYLLIKKTLYIKNC